MHAILYGLIAGSKRMLSFPSFFDPANSFATNACVKLLAHRASDRFIKKEIASRIVGYTFFTYCAMDLSAHVLVAVAKAPFAAAKIVLDPISPRIVSDRLSIGAVGAHLRMAVDAIIAIFIDIPRVLINPDRVTACYIYRGIPQPPVRSLIERTLSALSPYKREIAIGVTVTALTVVAAMTLSRMRAPVPVSPAAKKPIPTFMAAVPDSSKLPPTISQVMTRVNAEMAVAEAPAAAKASLEKLITRQPVWSRSMAPQAAEPVSAPLPKHTTVTSPPATSLIVPTAVMEDEIPVLPVRPSTVTQPHAPRTPVYSSTMPSLVDHTDILSRPDWKIVGLTISAGAFVGWIGAGSPGLQQAVNLVNSTVTNLARVVQQVLESLNLIAAQPAPRPVPVLPPPLRNWSDVPPYLQLVRQDYQDTTGIYRDILLLDQMTQYADREQQLDLFLLKLSAFSQARLGVRSRHIPSADVLAGLSWLEVGVRMRAALHNISIDIAQRNQQQQQAAQQQAAANDAMPPPPPQPLVLPPLPAHLTVNRDGRYESFADIDSDIRLLAQLHGYDQEIRLPQAIIVLEKMVAYCDTQGVWRYGLLPRRGELNDFAWGELVQSLYTAALGLREMVQVRQPQAQMPDVAALPPPAYEVPPQVSLRQSLIRVQDGFWMSAEAHRNWLTQIDREMIALREAIPENGQLREPWRAVDYNDRDTAIATLLSRLDELDQLMRHRELAIAHAEPAQQGDDAPPAYNVAPPPYA